MTTWHFNPKKNTLPRFSNARDAGSHPSPERRQLLPGPPKVNAKPGSVFGNAAFVRLVERAVWFVWMFFFVG